MKTTKIIMSLLVFLITFVIVIQSCQKEANGDAKNVSVNKSMEVWNPQTDSLLLAHWDLFQSTKWALTGDPKIDFLVKKLPQDSWRAALACSKWAVDPKGQISGSYIPSQHLYLNDKEIAILTAFLLGVPEVAIVEGDCGCIGNTTDKWITINNKAYESGSTGTEKDCTKWKDATCLVKAVSPE